MILRAFVGDKKLKKKMLGNICETTGVEGRDFTIVKEMVTSGEDRFPKYDQSSFEQPSPLAAPDEVDAILALSHDLTELRTLKGFDVLDHNLQVELGMKSDDEAGFDPRKYNLDGSSPAVTLAPKVEAKVEMPAVVETPPVPEPEPEQEEEVMADVDFMKELEEM
jgi:hypothetical protein